LKNPLVNPQANKKKELRIKMTGINFLFIIYDLHLYMYKLT